MRKFLLVIAVVVASGLFAGPALLTQVSGPYEAVDGWLQPFAEAGYAFGSATGVFAESPERIFVAQSGEIRLPDPVPDGFNGYVGSIGLNAFEAGENRVWRNSIFVVDGDGNLIDAWTQWDEMFEGGAGPHKIKINPFDPDRKVWVVDETNHQVHAFSNDGSELVMSLGAGGAGSDETHFDSPRDVAFLEDGSIFVGDSGNSRVVKLDAAGNFVTSWGVQGNERGQFNGVHAVATDSIGRIYVADRDNDRVQVFNETTRSTWYHPNISPVATWPGFESASDIYATGYEVWIADNMPTRMVKLDWNGNPLYEFGADGAAAGQFGELHQFSVDAERNFYGADSVHGRVQKLVPSEGAGFTELMGRPDPALR